MTTQSRRARSSAERDTSKSGGGTEPGLDLLEEGFGVFDQSLVLRTCNARLGELLACPDRICRPGSPLQAFFRFSAERGDFGEGDVRSHVAHHLQAIEGSGLHRFDCRVGHGKILNVRCQRTPTGGVLLSCRDVSRERETEEALRQSEERCALIAAAAEDGIYEWFIESDEIYVSPRLDRFFKFEVGELGPKEWNWDQRIHRDDRENYLSTLKAILEGQGDHWECEYRFRDKFDEYRWVLDHGHIVRDEDGKATRLAGAIRDITKRKEAEEALRESEERYALAMQAINEGVYDWDIASNSIYYSPRVAALTGLLPEELETVEDWTSRVHPDDLALYRDALVAHFKSGEDHFACDYRYRAHDGQWHWARQHGLTIRDETGRAVRMIGSTGDITELKEREGELADKTAILETTLENIDQGITMVDANLHTIALNRKFLELLELPMDRFQPGFHMEDAFRYNAERGEYGEGDVEEQVRERLELARRFEPHAFERTRPDGTVIAIRGKPVEAGGFVSTYTDITERKRTEKALRQSEERYALAIRAATEGIYEWNVETDTLFLSDRAKEVLGFPSLPLTPASWNARIHTDDFEGYRQAIIEHFKGNTDHLEDEYRMLDTHGDYVWLLDRGIAVRDEAGRAIRLLGAITDITARRRGAEELRQARDQAEAATRAKSQFLANMSHELRTPLNAIIGFSRLVMRRSRDVLETRQQENLEKILLSAEHLLSLINTILDLSKIEAERMDIHPADFDLEPLLDHCLRTIEPLVKPDRVELIKQVEPGLPAMHTDQDKLRQLLINLLSNAGKFTEQGSIRLCAAREDDDTIAIQVADTGSGIADDTLEHIFEEFYQVDSSSTRQHTGTGLGLAIGRRLARLLGGDIDVESEMSVGSTFTVTLPMRYRGESGSST